MFCAPTSHACKFADHGEVNLVASSIQRGGREFVRVTVSNDGIGITPEQIARLFNPFTQADASTTRKYGGTGLALSIRHRLCEMLGGSLGVTSEAGKSSVFTVELPILTADADSPKAEAIPVLGRTSSPDLENEKPLVLVIDDEEDAREMPRRILLREGYRVITARSGAGGAAPRQGASAHAGDPRCDHARHGRLGRAGGAQSRSRDLADPRGSRDHEG